MRLEECAAAERRAHGHNVDSTRLTLLTTNYGVMPDWDTGPGTVWSQIEGDVCEYVHPPHTIPINWQFPKELEGDDRQIK